MAENNGINPITVLAQKLKNFFFSKDILSFLLFLMLSAGFWFLHALDKERETTIQIPISYVGIPPNIIISNTPTASITLTVRDQGLNLLHYSTARISPLVINLSKYRNDDVILINKDLLRSKFASYLLPSTTLLESFPDTILVQFQKLSSAVLPVEFVSQLELANQYMLCDKVQLTPQKVTVYGPQKVIRKLKAVRTELVCLKNITDSTTISCKLQAIRSVRFSTNNIRVNLPVEPFTEKTIQCPVLFTNVPKNLTIRSFPALVNMTCNVGISKFNLPITNDQIQVYVDFKDLKVGKSPKQKLNFTNNTSFLSNIRLQPDEVEFILEEH